MEDIIQILIFAGAMVLSIIIQSAKNKKKAETASPKDVLEDMFPDIDLPKDMEEAAPVQPIQTASPLKRTSPKANKKTYKPQQVQQVKQAPPAPTPKPTEKIRINTRKEARRAFIHSEIFNRKY